MAKSAPRLYLASSEYLTKGLTGEDNQIVGARWQFIEALQRQAPEIFKELRDELYPLYEYFADLPPRFHWRPNYWEVGWTYGTWKTCSDPDNQFAPKLLDWATKYQLVKEVWFLEGALETLSRWRKFPKWRQNLEVHGFRRHVAVPLVVPDHEHHFEFKDWGWDPQFISAQAWRFDVNKRFKQAVDEHIKTIGKLAASRGATKAVSRFSVEHFDWLVLYLCRRLKLDDIRIQTAPNIADRTAIFHGIQNAAKLAQIELPDKLK